MKAILISIKPKWVAKILNGEKKGEVRKGTTLYKAITKLIEEHGEATLYIYCTKEESLIYTDGTDGKGDYVDYKYYANYKGMEDDVGSGKVVAKFICRKVEEIFGYPYEPYYCDSDLFFETNSLRSNKLLEKSCLNHEELENYLNDVSPYGYFLHIDNLEIFDKPKELNEFKKNNAVGNCWKCKLFGSGCSTCQLTKAPQSWCYVEE